jgi:thiol-disulfide isomerase/thioredoxin
VDHRLEGVDSQQPFHNSDESVQPGTSSYDYVDFGTSFSNQPPLPYHESPSFPTLDFSQYDDDGFAENSQPQYRFNETYNNPQLHSLSPISSNSTISSCPQLRPELSSDKNSPFMETITATHTTCLADNVPASKPKLDLFWTTFTCPNCKEVFNQEALFVRHKRHADCAMPSMGTGFTCQACGKSINSLKDLNRHQGGASSAPSCKVLKAQAKQLKPFLCTCGKGYSRIDGLQRHVKKTSCPKQA